MNKRRQWYWSVVAAACLAGIGCEQERQDFASSAAPTSFSAHAMPGDVAKLAIPAKSSRAQQDWMVEARASATVRAVAVLEPTEGHSAAGEIAFLQDGDHTHITGFIGNLTPGAHGFHIHEKGDCSAPDASSAGPHFATDPNQKHGPPSAPLGERHAGDLGNIEADANGVAEIAIADSDLRLTGADSAMGRAVIVHLEADDLHSQPSGDAGDRVACGVIVQSDSLALSTRM